jgi:hypothetical protein
MIESAPYSLDAFSIDEGSVHVRVIDANTAVVAYRVNERMTVDGQAVALEAYDTSVWVKQAGGWACVLHTESLAGDPFGRRA